MSDVRLGYFGPAGTFTHAALLASGHAFGEAVPYATERETILAAARGEVAAAMVPIENSIEGGVNATLDALALEVEDAEIVGEEVLPVSHALAVRRSLTLDDVVAVTSHPQALAQCRRFIAEHLPGRRIIAATSTAEAVRTAATSNERLAAIGTTTAAELYECDVLAAGIEDEHGNQTRFVWVAARGTAPFAPRPDRPAKTSIVFHGAGDASPGWLVRCLDEFAGRGINLNRIESRPLKRQLGHYLFLTDLEGSVADANVAEAIERLHAHCEVVRVLGSFPSAGPAGFEPG
ncbi:MAG TPA: prephenate dehydratase [Baekduia sp.]|uniref:prephenate dehydratase n=1 Tax=Baekduia sp. TaxID=2600305 RepID=UPI002D7861BB|nr:prephenate dehydratase [Baekduia sp.]HET6508822.1 prephenate dehydratase [Baekduia sp.]